MTVGSYEATRKKYGIDKLDRYEKEYLSNSKQSLLDDEQLISIFHTFGRRLEYAERPGLVESALFEKVKKGRAIYYHLYAYRFWDEDTILRLEERINELLLDIPFLRAAFYETEAKELVKIVAKKRSSIISVRDISSRHLRDKESIIDNYVLSARRELYYPAKCFPIHINVFKLEKNDFICFLSLCEEAECIKQKSNILKTLFSTDAYEQLQYETKVTQDSMVRAATYWKSLLKEPVTVMNLRKYKDVGIGTEIKLLDEDVSKLLETYSKKDFLRLKSIFLAVWGIILHKYYNLTDIIIGDANETGKLKLVPIRICKKDDLREMMRDIRAQIEKGREFDIYPLEDFERELSFSFKEFVPAFQNFSDVKKTGFALGEIGQNKIYQIKPYEMPRLPFSVEYDLNSVTMKISYFYERSFFSNNDIEQLHSIFTSLIKGVLEKISGEGEGNTEVKLQGQNVVYEAASVLLEKMMYLKQTPLFASYFEDEFLAFAKKCRVVDYRMGETIVEEQGNVNHLYIIGSGTVEVSRTNLDHYATPIQILQTGDLFGVESVLKDTYVSNSYIVYSDIVKVIEIPRDIMMNEFVSHPEVLLELLELQQQQLSRFQALWSMD